MAGKCGKSAPLVKLKYKESISARQRRSCYGGRAFFVVPFDLLATRALVAPSGLYALYSPQVNMMTDEKDESTERLLREHEAMTRKLASLREQARKLGREFEEKLKPEILEAEVELTRLSGLLGKIGL
jgi:hypothetical protein